MTDSAAGEAAAFNAAVIEEFRANGGRVGGRLARMPLILLHHTGVRSGAERVTPLAYIKLPDGRIVIVGSNGGSPTHPAWCRNLWADPRAEIEIGTERYPVLAVEPDETGLAQLWPRLVEWAPAIGEHQAKVGRRIPVFVLTRTSRDGT
jgi:deazaflavin-dependent oxidoreductase (nitroreductase family)